MKRFVIVIPFFFVAGCAPYKPTSDAGTPPKDAASSDAATEAAIVCVPDFQACNASSVCCIASSICNINTGVCQTVCVGVGSVCTTNGQCCSGICNGTCE